VWSAWTQCSKTGRRRRRREAKPEAKPEANPEADANPEAAVLPVSAYDVPEQAYGLSAGLCTQSRQRAVEVPPQHYGKDCKGDYAESRFCQSYECPGNDRALEASLPCLVKIHYCFGALILASFCVSEASPFSNKWSNLMLATHFVFAQGLCICHD
jgi:hypothetical protein